MSNAEPAASLPAILQALGLAECAATLDIPRCRAVAVDAVRAMSESPRLSDGAREMAARALAILSDDAC